MIAFSRRAHSERFASHPSWRAPRNRQTHASLGGRWLVEFRNDMTADVHAVAGWLSVSSQMAAGRSPGTTGPLRSVTFTLATPSPPC